MVNILTNINKMNNHLSPQTIEHKNDPYIWCWKSRSLLWYAQKWGWVKLVNAIL